MTSSSTLQNAFSLIPALFTTQTKELFLLLSLKYLLRLPYSLSQVLPAGGFAVRTIVITPFIPPNGKPTLVSPMQRLISPERTVPFELSSAPTCGKTLEIPL